MQMSAEGGGRKNRRGRDIGGLSNYQLDIECALFHLVPLIHERGSTFISPIKKMTVFGSGLAL